jgi:hypothetical protein
VERIVTVRRAIGGECNKEECNKEECNKEECNGKEGDGKKTEITGEGRATRRVAVGRKAMRTESSMGRR